MAEKTPSSMTTHSLGDLTLKRAIFTDIDDADTYPYGGEGVLDQWFNRTDDPTGGMESVGTSNSSNTITFNAPEANCTGTLFMLIKGA